MGGLAYLDCDYSKYPTSCRLDDGVWDTSPVTDFGPGHGGGLCLGSRPKRKKLTADIHR